MTIDEPAAQSAARRASVSTFYTAMRILPRLKREAIFEIYAFCRAVDDIADRHGPRAERLQELQGWRAEVEALYRGMPSARLRGLAAAATRFGLAKEDLLAIIDGMEMDVVADIRAPDFSSLDLYCDRVASAVGRLCVKVFGMAAVEGKELAHHLGRALQLTNILRDLDEDAASGRLYLPREALHGAGIATTDPASALAHQAVAAACAPLIERARSHFRAADAIMGRCPRHTVRTPRIMAEAYKLKLDGLTRRGWTAPRHAVSSSRLGLMWILARHAIL
ncbi:MAG: presqualene diphosphate synthase HpnD [Pseudomonadota bacterium]|nr:presqualene diphosphate synthase HpnD [Pseudomonadota bacterium]